MADEMNNTYTPAPDNVKIDTKVVKKMAGEALLKIDGVLDAKGGLADTFKDEDDPTRGLSVSVSDDHEATVNAKIIVETGKNIPNIVNAATEAITNQLQNNAGLKVKSVCVEVVNTMTRDEYKAESELDPVYPNTYPMM